MELLNELLNKQLEFQKSLDSVNKKLDEQAQKKVTVNFDHQAIANQIKAGLPSPEQFEKANEQIRRTILNIPDSIPVRGSNDILGFTSLKGLLINWAVFLSLLVLVAVGITYSKNQEIKELEANSQGAFEFGSWVQKNHPKIWKIWKES